MGELHIGEMRGWGGGGGGGLKTSVGGQNIKVWQFGNNHVLLGLR